MTATIEDRSRARPARLLMVEDDPEDARRIAAHLEESGIPHDLVHVDTLERALSALDGHRFDLCLLDLSLPDGADVETDDRLWSRVGALPLVVMSGLDELDRAMAALQEGAEEYLVKDRVSPDVLGRLLRTVLERDRARRAHRKIEEKWSSVFMASPVAIVLSDADSGRLLEVNDAFVEMFGPGREELLGSSSLELGQWQDPDRRRELIETVKRDGSFEGEEAAYWDAEGRRGRMLLSCRHLKLSEGDRLLWTVQDISERVERVKEQSCLYDVSRLLHEGERPLGERLQAVVERIPAGWKYPEITAAKIEVNGRHYASEGFEAVDQRLGAELVVEGERVGELVVGYREERPRGDLGPFLTEERTLLEELAGRIQVELGRQGIRRRMRHVVETMTEAVTIVAPDGTITLANSAARRLHTDLDAELVGEDMTDLTPRARTLDGEPHPPGELPFQTVLRTGEAVTGFEHLIERADGERIAVSVNAAPIRNEDGELEGVVLTSRNVTGQHRTAEWRHLLQSSVEAAAHGVMITDREGEIVWANPAFSEMTGYGFGEVRGENPRILQSGVHGEAFYEELWETILAGETWEGEIVNRRKDDTLYVERMSVKPVRHRSDEITHYIAVKEDITEHKRRKEALRRSEARYRTLVDTMAEATVILDGDGQIIFANTEAERLLGLEESELTDRTYDDPDWAITNSDGGPISRSELPFRRVVESGEPVRNVEHAIVRSDGRRTVLSVNAAPMGEEGTGVEQVVATFRDITEQRRLQTRLEHQALHDPLTGLANRTLFEDRLEQALARSRRRGEPMGLLMIDLDGFKRVNDHLGHTAGDEVLEEVARRLEATVREADTVARWGGDEFVVVLPELDRPAVIEVVEHRLRDAVRVSIRAGGEELELGVTVGGVVQTEGGAPRTVGTDSPEDLVRFVDLALHRAKGRSPGAFYLFDPTDDLDEVPDLRLEQDLRRGLRAGEIEVFYQPIYRLEDDELWGLEALARWRHPERGLVPPGAFIPLAERVGLIRELGDEVFRQGCRQLAAWTRVREDTAELKLAVNLSARELQDPGLTDRMAKALEGAALAPDRVVVEVTETALMTSMSQARALRGMGLALCIDDFGTGYSTYTYLRELEPDGLKIDMSLVRDLPESTSDLAIVDSLITLGHRLGLTVVAEGIETQAQLRTLRDLGAELGQGFLLGRPAPADEIEGLLDGSRPRSGAK